MSLTLPVGMTEEGRPDILYIKKCVPGSIDVEVLHHYWFGLTM